MPKDLNISVLFDFYGDILTEKQRTLVDLYYNQDLSLSEIAENEGITRQGVRDGIKRAEILMFDLDGKLGLMDKNKTIQETSLKLIALAGKIEESENFSDIKKYAKQIKSSAKKLMS